MSSFMTSADVERAEIAADMAWGNLKGWHVARDQRPTMTAEDCREVAEDEVASRTRAERDADCDAEALSQAVLAHFGFRIVHGDVSNAVLSKIGEAE